MKLYVVELVVRGTRAKAIVAKVPVTISGTSPFSDEGDWSVREIDSKYFGQTEGWWTTKTNDDGDKELWLMNDEDPNFVSWLWRDLPTIVVNLQGVLKLPLFLGETGTGLIMPVNMTSYQIYWRVMERGF